MSRAANRESLRCEAEAFLCAVVRSSADTDLALPWASLTAAWGAYTGGDVDLAVATTEPADEPPAPPVHRKRKR